MQNIDVRFNASSNFDKVKADLTALKAQAASLGAVFEKNAYAKPPGLVDPVAWQKSTRAVHEASNAYRNAVSSSGLLTSQQIRATAESERYTKSLQKQKLTMGDMLKHRGIMTQVYQDQLRYQRMTAQYWGTDSAGRAITDITIPKNVPRDLDTVAQRMHFVGQAAKSAGTQIVNMGKNMQWAGRQLTVGFTYPVALFGAAAGVMAYKTEDAFTRIAKVYDYTAAAQTNAAQRDKEVNELRVQSMDNATAAAERYGVTVTDTLNIQQQLAASGLRGDELFKTTDEISRISMLGDIDAGQTTEMVMALKTAFRETIPGIDKDVNVLADTLNYMNAASNVSSLSLQDLAEATPRAATGIAQLGGDVKDMTTLLVAMREAGVNAAEGANALKSASTRIINPVPKALDFYEQYNINLKKLTKESGGNLFEYLRLLGEEQQKIQGPTEKQTNLLRAQGVATLFGTYQNNRLTAALVNLTDAYGGVDNQTRKVLELNEQSNAQLEKTAKISEDIVKKSPAQQFREELASLQIQLAKIGEPFLEFGTKILGLATDVAKFVNGMDGWQKKAALIVGGVMALAGPVVMMGGLFMNLAGQFITGTGRIMSGLGRLGGAIGLVTKEEKAATLAADAQNAALAKTQSTTSTLTKEISVLTAAYEKATAAARAYAESQGIVTASQAAGVRPQVGPHAAPIGPQLPAVTGPVSYSYPRGASAAEKTAARDAAYREMQMAEMRRQQAQEALNQKAAKEAAIREKIKNSVNGANLGMAAMGVSMAMMMLPLGETTNNIGKWLMIATIVVPAVKILATAIGGAAKGAWSMAAAQITAARAAKANAIATGATVGKFGTLRAGVSGLASGIGAALGPGGVLTLGLLAVGGAYYWAWNKGKEAREAAAAAYKEQVRLANEVESSTRKWAEQMGIVVGKYERVAEVSKLTATADAQDKQGELIEHYKTKPEGEDSAPIDPFKDMDKDSAEFQMNMVQKFIDLQAEAKLSAKDAAAHMRAFFIAMGLSADQADAKAQLLLDTWGSIDKKAFDWSGYLEQQMSLFNESDSAGLAAAGKNAAEAFWAGMANAKSPDQAQALVDQFTSSTQTNIEEVWTNLGNTYGREWYSMMEDQGVTNAQQFAELLRRTTMEELANLDWRNTDKTSQTEVWGPNGPETVEKPDGYSLPWGSIEMELEGVNAQQDQLLSGLNDIVNFGDDVQSVFDLPDYHKVQALTTSYGEAKDILSNMLEQNKMSYNYMSKEEQLMLANIVNAYNLAHGIKQGGDYTEAMANFFGKVKAEGKGAADEAGRIKKNVDSIRDKTVTIKIKQIGGIMQTAMGNIQQSMADSAMTQFNAGWDAQMDAAQQGWDNRSESLQNAHEAAMSKLERGQEAAQEAFDNRWERRREAIEKAYQKRIDRVNREIESEQKADEIRQRLFENEKRRLQALADAENTDIDFNTALNEGRLDDAAKTLNNAGVESGNAQMDAEQAAAEKRTQARIKALEKKNERLEKARDKELENLQKLEERMRKHLERVQEARRKALEKQQQDEVKALEKSEEAAMASLDRQREYEEATLQQRLDLFLAYTARNKKDLERWMRELGFEYDDFGDNVERKGASWAKSIRESLLAEIREAGTKVMNDNQWSKVGEGISNKLLKGMGFDGMADFRRFVNTGKMGGGGKKDDTETRHEGGMVGSGGGSRKGVPNTYKGLHRSEKMVRAQKGEYVINKQATAKHRDIIESINSGNFDKEGNRIPGTGGEFGGPGAFVSAALVNMFRKGTEKAFQNNYQKGLAKQAARLSAGGTYGAPKPGKYGDAVFNAEQLKNAATIASTASKLGASKRDIQIALMTAMQESTLRNLDWGDRDSVGLFQQRDAWGSFADRTNPVKATKMFFHGGAAGQRGLFDFPDRGSMSLAQAAQAVQVSAYPDAYAKWANEASAIMAAMKQTGGGVSGPGGSKGSGKYWRASDPGKGWRNSHDYGNGMRSPVYAIGPGVVRTVQLPPSAGSGQHPDAEPRGYGSYGVVSYLTTDDGKRVTYAHLYPGTQVSGRVAGGQRIALSASTGNSSGPHTHFEVNGSTNAQGAFAAMGIPLRTGGTIKYDNTPASLHKGETVLTAPLTQKFKENVASGGGGEYNVTIDLRGAYVKEDVDIEKAVNTAIDKRESKVGRKRVVK